jgi:phosphatidylglycerophosphate synthase
VTHQRFNRSLVATMEQQLLRAIAPRLPKAASPDRLTALGVLGAAIVLVGYVLSSVDVRLLWLANLGLGLHWFGDSLDGTVARFRGIERPQYGFFLDQTVDVVSNLLIALGIGLSPWARLDVALIVLAAFHMLSLYGLIRSLVDREFHVDVAGLGPTEMRLGIFGLNIAIMIFGARPFALFGLRLSWCDLLMLVTAAGLMLLFLWEVATYARKLARLEP